MERRAKCFLPTSFAGTQHGKRLHRNPLLLRCCLFYFWVIAFDLKKGGEEAWGGVKGEVGVWKGGGILDWMWCIEHETQAVTYAFPPGYRENA
jgi:hypothetical protein